MPKKPYLWTKTLVVTRRFAGLKLGARLVNEAVDVARHSLNPGESTYIYLDCMYGSGFLPAYYASLGFETVARKLLKLPQQDYDGVLMRLPIHGG